MERGMKGRPAIVAGCGGLPTEHSEHYFQNHDVEEFGSIRIQRIDCMVDVGWTMEQGCAGTRRKRDEAERSRHCESWPVRFRAAGGWRENRSPRLYNYAQLAKLQGRAQKENIYRRRHSPSIKYLSFYMALAACCAMFSYNVLR